ncbi:helix-turn-helix domain-containing protein [Cupriavidus alkaliphilus]|uniref:helix-turn-helix domain-containing protein n=1 Tax=Cupriavidus alkaliphilus TaxID=942866 RepID=UPI0016164F27|nr:helix-turn-helix transcriptional regulator [Cupriavidus alkaliphilus]MBB3016886.1 transcriptional regulator with XRE-family HTH domain [Cupriavidus alkaliphilus]
MRIDKYLDAIKAQRGLKTDTELAEILGVKQNAVSQYRNGKRMPDNEACLRIAQALDMSDPMPVIMAADMDRAERAGQRSLWEVFSRRMAQAAAPATLAVLVASVTNFVTPSAAQAAPALDRDSRTLSVMSNRALPDSHAMGASATHPASSGRKISSTRMSAVAIAPAQEVHHHEANFSSPWSL